MLIALIVAVLVVLALLVASVLARPSPASVDALLPPELRGAELVMSERSLERTKPVRIRGRPDEVWEKGGRRIIIETKSRAGGVFDGDRMQLAAYAYLLRGDGGPPVAPHAYIRFTGADDGLRFQRVKLKDDAAVIAAHRQFHRVRSGRQRPGFAEHAALCRGCGHRARCPAPRTG